MRTLNDDYEAEEEFREALARDEDEVVTRKKKKHTKREELKKRKLKYIKLIVPKAFEIKTNKGPLVFDHLYNYGEADEDGVPLKRFDRYLGAYLRYGLNPKQVKLASIELIDTVLTNLYDYPHLPISKIGAMTNKYFQEKSVSVLVRNYCRYVNPKLFEELELESGGVGYRLTELLGQRRSEYEKPKKFRIKLARLATLVEAIQKTHKILNMGELLDFANTDKLPAPEAGFVVHSFDSIIENPEPIGRVQFEPRSKKIKSNAQERILCNTHASDETDDRDDDNNTIEEHKTIVKTSVPTNLITFVLGGHYTTKISAERVRFEAIVVAKDYNAAAFMFRDYVQDDYGQRLDVDSIVKVSSAAIDPSENAESKVIRCYRL